MRSDVTWSPVNTTPAASGNTIFCTTTAIRISGAFTEDPRHQRIRRFGCRNPSRLVVTPLVTVAAASLSVGAAHASPWNSVDLFPPRYPVETPFCSIDYIDPNDFGRSDRSDVTVSSPASGQVVFTFHTRSESAAPYTQRAYVVWANLDTGFRGGAEATARIAEGETIIELPAQVTEPGRITAVTGVTNTADNGQDVTHYDCSTECTVP